MHHARAFAATMLILLASGCAAPTPSILEALALPTEQDDPAVVLAFERWEVVPDHLGVPRRVARFTLYNGSAEPLWYYAHFQSMPHVSSLDDRGDTRVSFAGCGNGVDRFPVAPGETFRFGFSPAYEPRRLGLEYTTTYNGGTFRWALSDPIPKPPPRQVLAATDSPEKP